MKLRRLIFAASLFMVGCQTVPYQGQARDIKRKPQDEGVIGIPLNFRDEDRARAEQKMRSNCNPIAFKVLEEGEVVVGQEVKSSGRETDRKSTEHKVGSLFGVPLMSGDQGGKNTESSQVTSAVKEWQISYKCLVSDNTQPKKTKVR